MYNEYQNRSITEHIKYDQYLIPLKQFLQSYKERYGTLSNSHHIDDKYKSEYGYQYGECIRLLQEYGHYYTLDISNGHTSDRKMRRYRLWNIEYAVEDVEKEHPFIKFDTNGMYRKICHNHVLGCDDVKGCTYKPSYMCPWLHPDLNLVHMIESCKQWSKCKLYHISKQLTRASIEQKIHPFSHSREWIQQFFDRYYTNAAQKQKPRNSRLSRTYQVGNGDGVNVDSNGILHQPSVVPAFPVRRDFLHFADQIFDCFDRRCNIWMNASVLISRMQKYYPGRTVLLSKYRFLQSREIIIDIMNDHQTLQYMFYARSEDLCPVGDQCSWFGCCRLHHISYEEICDPMSCLMGVGRCQKLHFSSQVMFDFSVLKNNVSVTCIKCKDEQKHFIKHIQK